MIKGVRVKKLIVHKDGRGFFCELIRKTDSFFDRFGQVSHSRVKKGVLKAWHWHKKQTDYMYVVRGDIRLVLYDRRKNSGTYRRLDMIMMGEKYGAKVVKIPAGVVHGYKVINGPMDIIYVMDREYDPADELRMASDDPEISYKW